MNTHDALKVLHTLVGEGDLLLCGSGALGRALGALAERPSILLMSGATGLGLAVGLGLALAQPKRRVFVLDGGSDVLTGMNALTSTGVERPPNLIHVVVDARPPGRPAIPGEVQIESVASAAGYRATHRADSVETLEASLRAALVQPGPVMIVAIVEAEAPRDLDRGTTPSELAARFAAEARR